MALPFDLRLYVASIDRSDSSSDPSPRSARSIGGRPSRAVLLPEGLIAQVQARDVTAFQDLIRLVYVPLTRFAQTILGGRDEAEDVVQDVLVAVWDRAELWNPSDNPVAYLFSSVRNHALNDVRRSTRATQRAQKIAATERAANQGSQGEDCLGDPLSQLIATETETQHARMVQEVLACCTERQRAAYDLRYRRGMTIPAIAQVLGISERSTERLVSRTTQQIAQRLREKIDALG